jgi:hypothetical protein
MEIHDVAPANFRVSVQNQNAAGAQLLTVGQQANVKVLQAGPEGLWQLSVNGKEVWAHSETSFSPGQIFRAQIAQTGSMIQLQILEFTGNPEIIPGSPPVIANDLIKLIAARSGLSEMPLMDAAAWMSTLRQLLEVPGMVFTPEQTSKLAKLLAPIALNSTSQQVADGLQTGLGNSGLFFESKLRQLLETTPAASNQTIPKLASDLKTLLGQMAQSIDEAGSRSPQPEWIASTAQLKDKLIDQLLARQTEAAYQWIKDDTFCAEVPLLFFSHSTDARVRFFLKSPHKPISANRPLTVSISLCLPNTGKLEAWAQWEKGKIHARIYVENEAIRQLFRTQVQELVNSLRGLGFEQITADILMDPIRLINSDSTLEEESNLHGGFLLNLHA